MILCAQDRALADFVRVALVKTNRVRAARGAIHLDGCDLPEEDRTISSRQSAARRPVSGFLLSRVDALDGAALVCLVVDEDVDDHAANRICLP